MKNQVVKVLVLYGLGQPIWSDTAFTYFERR